MSIDPSLSRFARMRAKQVAGWYGFSLDEEEDLFQELTLEHLRSLSRYDQRKSSIRTYGRRVIDNHLATLIEAKKAQCRDYKRTQSFEEIGFRGLRRPKAWISPPRSDLPIDVRQALNRLRPDLRLICRLLNSRGARPTARAMGLSRATLYRRIAEIRSAFDAAGLRAYFPVRRNRSEVTSLQGSIQIASPGETLPPG